MAVCPQAEYSSSPGLQVRRLIRRLQESFCEKDVVEAKNSLIKIKNPGSSCFNAANYDGKILKTKADIKYGSFQLKRSRALVFIRTTKNK